MASSSSLVISDALSFMLSTAEAPPPTSSYCCCCWYKQREQEMKQHSMRFATGTGSEQVRLAAAWAASGNSGKEGQARGVRISRRLNRSCVFT